MCAGDVDLRRMQVVVERTIDAMSGSMNGSKGSSEDHRFYIARRPAAESVKVWMQMFIGLVIFVTILLKIMCFLFPRLLQWLYFPLQSILEAPPLEIVAAGLALSAGVELCYMLYTPGPDEAIEPLILGLSSSALLIISRTGAEFSWQSSLAVFVFVGAIVGLFWTRKKLL